MLRVGVIGAGRHGERYVRHLARGDVAGAHVGALWRRDAGKGNALARDVGARFEPDLDRLIGAPDIDVLVAAVPVSMHEDVAGRVAAANKPLLLEKPIAGDVASASRIERLFSAATPLMVAQTLRFDPLVVALRARAAELGGLSGFTFEQRIEPRGLAWEDEPETSMGGVLLQTAIHTVDALRFVTSASSVRVTAAHLSQIGYRHNEDQAVVIATVDTPLAVARGDARPAIPGSITSSKVGQARTVRFALHHTDATLEIDLIGRRFVESRGRVREERAVPEAPTVAATLSAFLACVRGEIANPVPASEAIAALAVVEAAYALGRVS